MKIIECPRDAWQGHHPFIPTEVKAAYINELLKVGFDTIDFGSFVSPKAMPQVSDTSKLLGKLDLSTTHSSLLSIVANLRGAETACQFEEIGYIGYPFSISETFQIRNTNSTIADSLTIVQRMADLCLQKGKKPVIYISMGFGNPYGDPWNPEIVMQWIEKLRAEGIHIFALSDTVGVAKTEEIHALFSTVILQWPDLEFGAHFHTKPLEWHAKIDAAYAAGCRRYDGAILGYGGCPMAQDDLVGNMPTEQLIQFSRDKKEFTSLNLDAFETAKAMFQTLII